MCWHCFIIWPPVNSKIPIFNILEHLEQLALSLFSSIFPFFIKIKSGLDSERSSIEVPRIGTGKDSNIQLIISKYYDD